MGYNLVVENLEAGYGLGGFSLFGRHTVIKGLSFEIQAGEVIGLIARNASGKSTLLRAIVDSEFRFGGKVLSNGEPLKAGQIAYMPQSPAGTLSPWLNVETEIALPLRVLGIKKREVWQQSINKLVADFGIVLPMSNRVEQLSGGQRVKVALLRSLMVQDIRLMVLDEPFEGLDVASRNAMITAIRKVSANGIPIIITSHRQEDLDILADRQIKLVGTPVSKVDSINIKSVTPEEEITNSTGELELHPRQIENEKTSSQYSYLSLFGILGGFLIWLILAELLNKYALLPNPLGVVKAMLQLLTNSELVPHFSATIFRALGWWLVANLLAIPIGILLGYHIALYQTVSPWLSVGRSLPSFVLVGPAIGLLPGYPEMQRGLLICLALFLVALQAISVASALAPRKRVAIAKVLGASNWFCLRHIMPYEAITGIFSSLEVTLPLAMIITLVVETFLIPKLGLGLYIFNHLTDPDLSLLVAHIFWPAVIAAIGMRVIRRVSSGYRYEVL